MPALNTSLKKIKEKLFRLEQFLILWNKTNFGNIFQKVKILEKEIELDESIALQNPSSVNCRRLEEKQANFAIALDQEEAFWKQKASASWCVEGEKNTYLFHNMVKRKFARMGINQITEQDTIITKEKEIKESVVGFFIAHFAGDINDLEPATLDVPSHMITEEQNVDLCRPPTLEEVKQVVFGLKPDSAPGPDGYTWKFFQFCWDIIKFDVLEGVLDFFAGNDIPLGFTHTLIALNPKVSSPQK